MNRHNSYSHFNFRLQDWNGTILSFHAVQWHCSLYSLIPYTPPKGKSLQSIQEAWSNLESAVSKRRSTLLNLANQSQKQRHQQQKVMKRVSVGDGQIDNVVSKGYIYST